METLENVKDPDEIFIRNVKSVDVDGLKGINHYTIKEMYNAKQIFSNGTIYYNLQHRLIAKFSMTWDEIERDGGVGAVNREMDECYNVTKW